MAASKLPLEIQQQIFSMLDSRSFHNARGVCRYWRFASTGSLTLVQHLGRLPVRLASGQLQHVNLRKLNLLFTQTAHVLMFGLVVNEEASVANTLHSSCKLPVRPSTAASRDGKKSVALNDKTVTLFDTSSVSPIAMVQIKLQDFRGLPVGFPGLRPSASTQHQLALSSDGGLLAVAMDRTIQIYDLSDWSNRSVVTRHLADGSLQRIARLDFEQNDNMLRVQLTGDDTVLYLGSPGVDEATTADLNHWNSGRGLRHTFMDSSRFSIASKLGDGIRLSGVQLLRRVGNGFLFAAQRHGGRASSQYMLGHLKCATNSYTSTKAVEHMSSVELVALESFLSSCDLAMTELANIGMGTWDLMPSAHEPPQFALSGDLLVVAERGKNSKHIMPHRTQIFLYRVPSERKILSLMSRVGSQEGSLAESEVQTREYSNDFIAAVPLCVGAIAGEVRDIQIHTRSANDGPCRTLTVRSEEVTKVWSLVG